MERPRNPVWSGNEQGFGITSGNKVKPGGGMMRAMVVEDEILAAMHLEDQLETLGIRSIGIAADSAEAARLSEHDPDLAFVDMNLRDGPTGTTIAARLAGLGVLVFYVTANPSQLGEGVCHALAVLGKPCLEADLKLALEQIPLH